MHSTGPIQARFPLFQIKVDPSNALVEITLEGVIRLDEMQQFVEQCLGVARALSAQGKHIRILADVRQLRTTSPEAAELFRQAQESALKMGLKRVAGLVGSELATLQLNRIARASGMESVLRRFQTEEEARRWILDTNDTLDAA